MPPCARQAGSGATLLSGGSISQALENPFRQKLPGGGVHSRQPDVSVIIVSYNTAHLLPRLLDSLHASRGSLSLQTIVVDNASTDNSVELLRTEYHGVEVIENERNVGFGRANNQALELAFGRYILLLNTDAFVAPDTLSRTLAFMEARPDIGVAGARLIGADGAVQPSCRFFPTPWNVFLTESGLNWLFPSAKLVDDPAWDPEAEQECDWVPGCFFLMRRAVLEQVGLFDERYFLYYEEVDHCRAVKAAGWKIAYFPQATVVHLGGASATVLARIAEATRQIPAMQTESELLYFRKHYGAAGVLCATALATVAHVVRAVRTLVRQRGWARVGIALRAVPTLMAVLARTHLGARPTR